MKFATALRHLDATIKSVRRVVKDEETAPLVLLETVRRALVEADHPEMAKEEHSLFGWAGIS